MPYFVICIPMGTKWVYESCREENYSSLPGLRNGANADFLAFLLQFGNSALFFLAINADNSPHYPNSEVFTPGGNGPIRDCNVQPSQQGLYSLEEACHEGEVNRHHSD